MRGLLSTAEKGSTFFLGHYPNSDSSVTAPIVWRIIGNAENRILVISQFGLDAVPFHAEFENVSWVACSQREWLNRTFLYSAFNEEEQRNIVAVKRNNNTEDYVFSLNMTEALRYLPMEEDRVCIATEYAKMNGVFTTNTGHCLWWLRSGTYTRYRAQIIERNGEIDTSEYRPNAGAEVDDPQIAIRPAMWLRGNTTVDFTGVHGHCKEKKGE